MIKKKVIALIGITSTIILGVLLSPFLFQLFTQQNTPQDNDLSPGNFILSSDANNPDKDGSFTLNWTASEHSDNYIVYSYSAPILEINESLTIEALTTNTFFFISEKANGIHYFVVQANNSVGKTLSNYLIVDIIDKPWTWISGDETSRRIGKYDTYGTKGVPLDTNKPGARYNSVSWTDSNDNHWLFGGYGNDNSSSYGYLNDLWRYNTTSGLWTWVSGDNIRNQGNNHGTKGIPSVSNKPGGRYYSVSWTDSHDNLWLFGGLGYSLTASSGRLNDLWRYNTTSSLWTWISGDIQLNQNGIYGTKGIPSINNKPGARYASISWTDSHDNLWLFGGHGYDNSSSGYLNDLWRYNTTSGLWTWVSGDNIRNQYGDYGTKGMPSVTNKPGVRYDSISWTDPHDNLWLFGGYGFDNVTTGRLNDLWRYNMTSGLWTWVSGDKSRNQLGDYGTKGVPSETNKPGSRYRSLSWIDSNGNLWLFGGYGYDNSSIEYLNDLWRYNATSGNWTWILGFHQIDLYNTCGNYGTKGMPSVTNKPGARFESISWTDSHDNLWLFGGYGYDISSSYGYLNDLWMYNATSGLWTWVSGDYLTYQRGDYGTKGKPSVTNKPGSRYRSISWIDSQDNLWLFGGSGYTNISSGYLNDLWMYNTTSGLWTWVSGDYICNSLSNYGAKGVPIDTNKPGGRYESISWIDSNDNLWLFGGSGYTNSSGGYLNDLWMYNTTSGLWIWVSGDYLTYQLGDYGTKGIPSVTNMPGARGYSISWIDSNDNLWLFGGSGYTNISSGYLNDLWMYNTTSGHWTWISGYYEIGALSSYGIKGIPSVNNNPGARYGSISWTDSNDNLWLFGGIGYDAVAKTAHLNDLWMYNTTSSLWTWVSGDYLGDQLGDYGTNGLPSATNKPGSRYGSISWIDSNNDLWLFGGGGYGASSWMYLNDLWRFEL